MSWNHRILAKEYNDEISLQVHEVYYDKNHVPNGYTQNPIAVSGETLEDILWTLERMKDATKKPILWEGDRFPQEYNPTSSIPVVPFPGKPLTGEVFKDKFEEANEHSRLLPLDKEYWKQVIISIRETGKELEIYDTDISLPPKEPEEVKLYKVEEEQSVSMKEYNILLEERDMLLLRLDQAENHINELTNNP